MGLASLEPGVRGGAKMVARGAAVRTCSFAAKYLRAFPRRGWFRRFSIVPAGRTRQGTGGKQQHIISSTDHDLDHLDPSLPVCDVVQTLYGTYPAQEACPTYRSHAYDEAPMRQHEIDHTREVRVIYVS